MAKSNIVLIGMPGAGKSTLGVVLAKILGYDFLDADLLIQNKHGRTLQKLIDANGPLGFIDLENEALKSIDCEHTIIATGGSAVYSEEAMRHLAGIGDVVYLRVSLEELTNRLGGLHERGVVMLGNVRSLAELYDEREPLYETYAEITVDVDGQSVRETARLLTDILSMR